MCGSESTLASLFSPLSVCSDGSGGNVVALSVCFITSSGQPSTSVSPSDLLLAAVVREESQGEGDVEIYYSYATYQPGRKKRPLEGQTDFSSSFVYVGVDGHRFNLEYHIQPGDPNSKAVTLSVSVGSYIGIGTLCLAVSTFYSSPALDHFCVYFRVLTRYRYALRVWICHLDVVHCVS